MCSVTSRNKACNKKVEYWESEGGGENACNIFPKD